MEDKANNPKKPLRAMTNKMKDLMDTYKKSGEGKSIPINSPDQAKEVFENLEDADHNQENNFGNGHANSSDNGTSKLVLNDDEANMVLNRIEDLEREKSEIDKERNELKEQLVRNVAELENFRRRTLKEKQDLIDYANERLLFKMLTVLDDFSAAIDAGKKSTDYNALLTGLELIYSKTTKLFEESGVKQMENVEGSQFNVDFHDALMVMPSDKPEGTVVQVVVPGYMMHDKVLRHTKVITSSGQAPQSDE